MATYKTHWINKLLSSGFQITYSSSGYCVKRDGRVITKKRYLGLPHSGKVAQKNIELFRLIALGIAEKEYLMTETKRMA